MTGSLTARILRFAAVVESVTGLTLMLDPVMVVELLAGVEITGIGILLGRCFGVALLALGLTCWPGPHAARRGMLVYNGLIAIYLGYAGAVGLAGGWLLWPVVLLHAVVALLLAWRWARDDG